MYLSGVYVPVVDLLVVLLTLVALCLLYLGYEINKLKRLEKRFEAAEKRLESAARKRK